MAFTDWEALACWDGPTWSEIHPADAHSKAGLVLESLLREIFPNLPPLPQGALRRHPLLDVAGTMLWWIYKLTGYPRL